MSRRMQWIVFFAAVASVGACAGVFESTFNNYLSDTHNLGADARGFLEFPRELLGSLADIFAGLLSMLAVVCLGYGYAERLANDAALAHRVAAICFVADDLLFALGTSRSVYVSRLSESPQELTSTLAMGVSINHIASMALPALGGLIWVHLGYERVFTVAAGLALFISCVSMLLPKKRAVAVNR